ncbi:hypothetical protein LCGC14_0455930, partial [marine sediment metagenome]
MAQFRRTIENVSMLLTTFKRRPNVIRVQSRFWDREFVRVDEGVWEARPWTPALPLALELEELYQAGASA